VLYKDGSIDTVRVFNDRRDQTFTIPLDREMQSFDYNRMSVIPAEYGINHRASLADVTETPSTERYHVSQLNSTVTVRRDDASEDASIILFDLLGRTVRTVSLAAGVMHTTFDMASLARGAYYVRIATPTTTQVQKLVYH
jgi:hypothetical protein